MMSRVESVAKKTAAGLQSKKNRAKYRLSGLALFSHHHRNQAGQQVDFILDLLEEDFGIVPQAKDTYTAIQP